MLKNNIRTSKPFPNEFRKSLSIATKAECLIKVIPGGVHSGYQLWTTLDKLYINYSTRGQERQNAFANKPKVHYNERKKVAPKTIKLC